MISVLFPVFFFLQVSVESQKMFIVVAFVKEAFEFIARKTTEAQMIVQT